MSIIPVGQLMRTSVRGSAITASASSASSRIERQRSYKVLPSSVTRNLRVERSMSRTPSLSSSPAMRRLSFDFWDVQRAASRCKGAVLDRYGEIKVIVEIRFSDCSTHGTV